MDEDITKTKLAALRLIAELAVKNGQECGNAEVDEQAMRRALDQAIDAALRELVEQAVKRALATGSANEQLNALLAAINGKAPDG